MITLRILPSKEYPIRKIKEYISTFYQNIGYKIDRIEMIERAFTQIHVLLFQPYLRSGKPARKLSCRENTALDLENWYDHHCLGYNPITPLALQMANVAGSFMAETKAGIFMLSPEVSEDQCKTVVEMTEALRSKNVVLYRTPLRDGVQDLMTAMEFLKLNGGNAISIYDRSSFFCELPPHYDLGKLKRAVSCIRAGKLPEEEFTGFWSILDPNPSLHKLYERTLIVHAVAILAYRELVSDFPYLGPLIYDVRMGNHFEIVAPIARLEEKTRYEFYLNYMFENYPVENWSLVPYKGTRDLIVKRFAYEKRSPLVFAPKTPMAADSWYAPEFLLVYQLKETLDDDTLCDERDELERLLEKGERNEEICMPGCDLEKSICCVKRKGRKIYPEEMEMEGDLTLVEEERLLKMEFGLRGYFRLADVLKGLFNDPPMYDEGARGERKVERDIVSYIVSMKDGGEIPILTKEEQKQIERKGEFRLGPWTYALIANFDA